MSVYCHLLLKLAISQNESANMFETKRNKLLNTFKSIKKQRTLENLFESSYPNIEYSETSFQYNNQITRSVKSVYGVRGLVFWDVEDEIEPITFKKIIHMCDAEIRFFTLRF